LSAALLFYSSSFFNLFIFFVPFSLLNGLPCSSSSDGVASDSQSKVFFFSRVSSFAYSLLSVLAFDGVMFCVSFCVGLVGVLLCLSGFDRPILVS
jgi:hypothetical protein